MSERAKELARIANEAHGVLARYGLAGVVVVIEPAAGDADANAKMGIGTVFAPEDAAHVLARAVDALEKAAPHIPASIARARREPATVIGKIQHGEEKKPPTN